MKQQLIAQKMKRSIRAIETRIYLLKSRESIASELRDRKAKMRRSKRIYPPVPKPSAA
jgi:hypothetical protein